MKTPTEKTVMNPVDGHLFSKISAAAVSLIGCAVLAGKKRLSTDLISTIRRVMGKIQEKITS